MWTHCSAFVTVAFSRCKRFVGGHSQGDMFFSIWIPKATFRQFSCAVLAAFLGRFEPVYMVACCSEGGWCGRIAGFLPPLLLAVAKGLLEVLLKGMCSFLYGFLRQRFGSFLVRFWLRFWVVSSLCKWWFAVAKGAGVDALFGFCQFSCAVLAAFLGRFEPVYMVVCCSEGGWCGRIVRLCRRCF